MDLGHFNGNNNNLFTLKNFINMEQTIERLAQLLRLVDPESLQQLNEALTNVYPQTPEKPRVKIKIGWALADAENPFNHMNIIFKIEEK